MASQEELNHYSEYGWVKVPKFFSDEMISTAIAKVDIFLNSTAESLTGREINHVGAILNSIHLM